MAWAFAIYDHTKKELFISRDRFGVKPLYFLANNRFAFASELKAFCKLKSFDRKLNYEVIPDLLQRYKYDGATDQTAMHGVRSLPAGHSLIISCTTGAISVTRWWKTEEHLQSVSSNFSEQVEQFKSLFMDAVRIRMRSDVSVGTCLSGGVDSSAVACAMAWLQTNSQSNLERCANNWQKSFVATFPGTPLDEKEHADIVIEAIKSKPSYLEFSHEESLHFLQNCIWSLDEPTGGYAISPWLLYRSLREAGTYVSLDGHGGDELLAGYAWYLDRAPEELNPSLMQEFHYTLLPTILRNYDRCSTAHGIEVRMPLMDYRIVTYAFSLPASSKIGGGYTKRILREAMAGMMPESIRLRRQKIGFNAPMIEWFNGGLVPLIKQITKSKFWLDNPFFDGKTLGPQICAKSEAQAWTMADWDTTYKISTIMNLTLWHHLFIEKELCIGE
jgi:asparagine synthase (glutamine-hydrolysing)